MNQPQVVPPAQSAYLGKVFITMAAQVSSGLAKFSGWMMIGFAAILGSLLANLEAAKKLLAPNALSSIAALFAFTVFLHLLQRYSAAIVASSAAGGREIEAHPIPPDMPIEVLMDGMENAFLWPTNRLMRLTTRKFRQGDLAAGGRQILTMAQIEAWLVVAQLLTVIGALGVLANALRG